MWFMTTPTTGALRETARQGEHTNGPPNAGAVWKAAPWRDSAKGTHNYKEIVCLVSFGTYHASQVHSIACGASVELHNRWALKATGSTRPVCEKGVKHTGEQSQSFTISVG